MLKKIFYKINLYTGMFAVCISIIYADRRQMVWSYESVVTPEGFAEMEIYNTALVQKTSSYLAWEHLVEFEYGLSKDFDIGLYHILTQKHRESLKYRGMKLRLRYVPHQLSIIKPLGYIEYIYKTDEMEIEGKVGVSAFLLEKKLTLTLNITGEQEWKTSGEKEFKLVPTAGIAYKIVPWFSAGTEYLNHNENVEGKWEHSVHFFGPTFSFSAKKGWLAFNWLFQLGNNLILDEHTKYQARLITGIYF